MIDNKNYSYNYKDSKPKHFSMDVIKQFFLKVKTAEGPLVSKTVIGTSIEYTNPNNCS